MRYSAPKIIYKDSFITLSFPMKKKTPQEKKKKKISVLGKGKDKKCYPSHKEIVKKEKKKSIERDFSLYYH